MLTSSWEWMSVLRIPFVVWLAQWSRHACHTLPHQIHELASCDHGDSTFAGIHFPFGLGHNPGTGKEMGLLRGCVIRGPLSRGETDKHWKKTGHHHTLRRCTCNGMASDGNPDICCGRMY